MNSHKTSENYRYYSYSDSLIKNIPEEIIRDHKLYPDKNEIIRIDPREWVKDIGQETESIEQLNSIIRATTYPFEPLPRIDNEAHIKEYKKSLLEYKDIETFNNYNLNLILKKFSNITYPSREDIDKFLLKNNLPITLIGLPIETAFKLRSSYPYAWFSKDIPSNWLEQNINFKYEYEKLNNNSSGINNINEDIKEEWKNTKESYIDLYDTYMDILNKSPPLPNPIILFGRTIGLGTFNIGEEIKEQGFRTKNYFYFSLENKSKYKCCILVISYPANHKFAFIKSSNEIITYEFLSYPGEIFRIDNIIDSEEIIETNNNNNKTLIFCHFVGYEPHISSDNITISPVIVGESEVIDGYKIFYNSNGTINSKGRHLNGKKEGMWDIYYSNGSINAFGNFKQGRQVGKWRIFSKDGIFTKNIYYDLGPI